MMVLRARWCGEAWLDRTCGWHVSSVRVVGHVSWVTCGVQDVSTASKMATLESALDLMERLRDASYTVAVKVSRATLAPAGVTRKVSRATLLG